MGVPKSRCRASVGWGDGAECLMMVGGGGCLKSSVQKPLLRQAGSATDFMCRTAIPSFGSHSSFLEEQLLC
jgi:hypothetical protein